MLVAGVDEAGRGPLAGPVVASAVILDPLRPIVGLDDSKKLSERARDALVPIIKQNALAWSVAEASVEEIDQLNILQATLLAMKRAVETLSLRPDSIEVDGLYCPQVCIPSAAIIKGDSKVAAIAAASILAKTTRDALLLNIDIQYPQYGFAVHKGYPTKAHILALNEFGPVAGLHRMTFAPVRKVLITQK